MTVPQRVTRNGSHLLGLNCLSTQFDAKESLSVINGCGEVKALTQLDEDVRDVEDYKERWTLEQRTLEQQVK